MKRALSLVVLALIGCAGGASPVEGAPPASAVPAPSAAPPDTGAVAAPPGSAAVVTPPPATASAAPSVAPSGAFASLRDGAPAGEVELDAWVTDIYTCPPCPPKAMCKPCDAPNFTVSTQKTTPGGESFRLYTKAGPPKDLAVGLRYHFKIAVRPGANMYERLEILGAKRLP